MTTSPTGAPADLSGWHQRSFSETVLTDSNGKVLGRVSRGISRSYLAIAGGESDEYITEEAAKRAVERKVL